MGVQAFDLIMRVRIMMSGGTIEGELKMKCPNCNGAHLVPGFLEGRFRAHTCSRCGGYWLFIEDYVAWKERNPEYKFSQDAMFEADDSKQVLLCPVTGAIMQKYRISHDSQHRLDYSPGVGGVWLDSGEWEYLKEQGFAGSINKIFTPHWQKSIRDNNAKVTFADIYKEKFGEEDYAKVKELREWLNNHPCKDDLRAYILAGNPYSAEK